MNEYTSNLLCHFVGRSKPDDNERFNLLLNIIKGRKLIANIREPERLKSTFEGNYQCEHVGEVFGQCDCVCFCDIPNSALSIHTAKYSKFGLGFDKAFIASQGAHPVMYIPKNYPIVERGDGSAEGKSSTPRIPEMYYPYLLRLSTNLLPLMEIGYIGVDLQKQEKNLISIGLGKHLDLLNDTVRTAFFGGKYHPLVYNILQGVGNQFAYVKLYDVNLPDDHPDNYYMEREWRSLENISFTLNDIKAIYLPDQRYVALFSEECPEYTGDFIILDE